MNPDHLVSWIIAAVPHQHRLAVMTGMLDHIAKHKDDASLSFDEIKRRAEADGAIRLDVPSA